MNEYVECILFPYGGSWWSDSGDCDCFLHDIITDTLIITITPISRIPPAGEIAVASFADAVLAITVVVVVE